MLFVSVQEFDRMYGGEMLGGDPGSHPPQRPMLRIVN